MYFFPVVVSWSPEDVLWSDVESRPQFAAPPKPPKFTCDTCGKKFTNRGSLQHHNSSHRGHTKCHVCGKVFGRIHTLKVHLISKHHWKYWDSFMFLAFYSGSSILSLGFNHVLHCIFYSANIFLYPPPPPPPTILKTFWVKQGFYQGNW
jgi:hypothetical protein